MRELTLDKLPKKVLGKLDLETVFVASRCVIAAEKLLIFRKLDGKELSAADISKRARISRKHCESFLDYLVYLGLLKKSGKLYRNSPLAKKHFVKERSIDWTRLWSVECALDYEGLTVIEDVLTTGEDWRKILGKDRRSDYDLTLRDPEWARDFTYALYDCQKPTAELLVKNLDLSNYSSLLDVGGGSGVISFALARKYPHLKACVLDFELVCKAADGIIRNEGMSRRIRTLVGDMNREIPRGFDVIMFWNIGHIDTAVIKKAYNSLPEGGLIVRNCSPGSRGEKPSPTRFLYEYMSVRPKGQTRSSILSSLKDAGFVSIKYRPISRDLGLITARKPTAR